MARAAFLQQLAFPFLGTMYLAAALRADGHEPELFLEGRGGQAALMDEVLAAHPDLACFTLTTGSQGWVLEAARALKRARPALPIVCGGPHPTFFPEFVREPSIDIICRGEGEEALVDLCRTLDAGRRPTAIPNLWIRNGETVEANEVRPLQSDLDTLPMPDRGLYFRKYPFLRRRQMPFITGRGCPYSCTFCFNHAQRELYRGRGPYCRKHSVGRVLEEIAATRRDWPFRWVYFQDDTFTLFPDWLTEFAGCYQDRIGLPFFCLVTVDSATPDRVAALARAGCRRAFFGLETGDEDRRRQVLRKGFDNEAVRRTATLLHRHGIRFRTYNILGLPGETMATAAATVRLNAEIGTDFPWCSLYAPFPGTPLAEEAAGLGLLRQAPGELDQASFFRSSPLESPWRDEFTNLQKLFGLAVRFPRWWPVIRQLVRLPPNPLFEAIFLGLYAWDLAGSECLSLREILRLGRRTVGQFFFARPRPPRDEGGA